LHAGLRQLHAHKKLPFIQSCLKDNLQNAINKFKQVGYLQESSSAAVVNSETDESVVILQSQPLNKDKASQMLWKLRNLHTISPEHYLSLTKAVQDCIKRTKGPEPIARL
jgi:hypothetical protein